MSAAVLRPADVSELAEAVGTAAAAGDRLMIRGGGSKDAIGASTDANRVDMGALSGIVDYDPAELVLTTRAGTPLAEVQALVEEQGQMLAFEPFDHGPVFGRDAGRATIGGVVAAGVAGSQRVSHGGARDHLLGFEAVSGRGERFVAGGKVVKNVTGYDLPKLAAGSWGRLFALVEVTLKVLPAPRVRSTYVLEGLSYPAAQHAMSRALGSQADVAAAAYLPPSGETASRTFFRIQGFAPSVAARGHILERLLAEDGRLRPLTEAGAAAAWAHFSTFDTLPGSLPLWRINLAPSRSVTVIEHLGRDGEWLADWGGGLVWLASDGEPDHIRRAVEHAGGHATLVRSPDPGATTPCFHPQSEGVANLERRIRRAFDPAGVFEAGRF
jgi:glycolate oxidase FAD binding subunit